MTGQRKPTQPTESVEQGLEKHLERTDEKHSRRLPRHTRALGELQRDPERAMREAPKPPEKKKK